MPELLTPQDLHQLTGYARAAKQVTWLKANGIPFRTDGPRVIVSHRHVTNWLEGRTVALSGDFDWSSVK